MIINNISRRKFMKSVAVSAILLSKSSAIANETKLKFVEQKECAVLEGIRF